MKTRPTIFISGVSHEFGFFRDAVEHEIEMKGLFGEPAGACAGLPMQRGCAMSKPNDSRGGAIAIRGLLVQTIVARLDITKAEPPFTEITLEPMVGDDQFDFLWKDAHASHAIQVKSTENSFTRADVERWTEKLQQARTDEHCRLVLVGNIPPSLVSLKSVGAVAIETKNLNLDDLVEQAAHRVAVFLEDEKLDAGTAKEREMVVHALESKLQHHSTNAKPISRDDFVKLLRQWIGSVPKPDAKIDISRIIKYAPDKLIGRGAETALLNDVWTKVQSHEAKRPHILTFVALGGEGKTSLVAKWATKLAYQNWPGCDAVFAWSFYSQGTREQMAASSDLFLKEALNFFGDEDDKQFAASNAGAFEKGQRLARIVGERRALLILDGLEPLQYAPTSPTPGELKDHGIAALLKGLAANSHGLCVSHYAVCPPRPARLHRKHRPRREAHAPFHRRRRGAAPVLRREGQLTEDHSERRWADAVERVREASRRCERPRAHVEPTCETLTLETSASAT
jgi:hypothetical protein